MVLFWECLSFFSKFGWVFNRVSVEFWNVKFKGVLRFLFFRLIEGEIEVFGDENFF